ncbi:MAG: bifunctional diguanylate cyclase/phosphodiesterase [Chloroflexi bacterium]|nr:bifunctional diguanylate cyclase/phosphodiesterase [Chloroflexota bacterium]
MDSSSHDSDSMTGLPDRRQFMKALMEATRNAGPGRQGAVVLFGLDDVSHLNDAHGYEAGDRCISFIGDLITCAAGDRDFVARISGHEFALLIRASDGASVKAATRGIVDKVSSADLPLPGHHEQLTTSAGIVLFPDHGANPETLLSLAGAAMRKSKSRAPGSVTLFEPEEHLPEIEEMASTRHLILGALANDRVVLHRQPIVRTSEGTVQHYEVLARIIDEDGQLKPPGLWIPHAEELGLMSAIDRRVVEMTFSSMGGADPIWGSLGAAINISSNSLGREMAEFIVAMGARYGIDQSSVIVEITETAANPELEEIRCFMEIVKRSGFKIAIDDFGSGNTSLRRIRELDIDIVKLDGSLVVPIENSQMDLMFLDSLIKLLHSLGLEIVAEYVENANLLRLLKECGVDYVQGFYLGRPEPFAALPV